MEKKMQNNALLQNGDIKKKVLPPVLKEPREAKTLQPPENK